MIKVTLLARIARRDTVWLSMRLLSAEKNLCPMALWLTILFRKCQTNYCSVDFCVEDH